ncbi:MAG TPA: DUF86 domain-containing protein [Saprospiraceae bacterium]|nr:DUF86 domain-containing protein [Saprospiraceae bacterium]HPN70072.1 DUF86 domain-containing protein [Saprospiraceae bacterium]
MNDVLLNKIAIIENCIKRIKEVYLPTDFKEDLTKQDSVILNLERLTQASIDAGSVIVKENNLGIPQSNREVFQKLEEKNFIDASLSISLQKMVGFRNIAVHDYQKLNIEIIEAIVSNHLGDIELL